MHSLPRPPHLTSRAETRLLSHCSISISVWLRSCRASATRKLFLYSVTLIPAYSWNSLVRCLLLAPAILASEPRGHRSAGFFVIAS